MTVMNSGFLDVMAGVFSAIFTFVCVISVPFCNGRSLEVISRRAYA